MATTPIYPDFGTLTVDVHDTIAVVSINDPDRRNALSRQVQNDLNNLWLKFADDEHVRAIVLTGKGKTFSAGGDIKAMAERFGTKRASQFALEISFSYRRLLSNMLDVRQPIVAAVNGDAIGLGGTLALLCDIGVIAEEARFGDPHIHLGLSAGDGAIALWPLMTSFARVKERILLGTLCTGKEAQELGFFNHSAPAAQVLDKAMEIAHKFAELPVWGLRMSKQILNKKVRLELDRLLDTALAWEMLTMNTDNHYEAAAAFLEKRKPVFGNP